MEKQNSPTVEDTAPAEPWEQTWISCVSATSFVDQTAKPKPPPLEVWCLFNVTLSQLLFIHL